MHEKANTAVDRLYERRAEFAQKLAEIGIMACNEMGEAVAEHPVIKWRNGQETPVKE